MQRKVRKSFVDVPVSNVVEEIYNAHLRPGHQDFVKVKKNKKKPLTVHNTAGIYRAKMTTQDLVLT